MRIALAHYHARGGGVTTVLTHSAAALRNLGHRVVILLGEPPERDLSADARVVEGLGYTHGGQARALADRMLLAAREALGGAPDLWHFHNHALGKNDALPGAVVELARQGQRLLLQIHDFAEDGRPDNYAKLRDRSALYPLAPRVHFAALNRRDRDVLVKAGAPEERVWLLPNPVLGEPVGRRAEPNLWLYPTRGPRRKNLGEALLLAAASNGRISLATTGQPRSGNDLAAHEAWRAFAWETNLPARFGVVERADDLKDWIARAGAIVTTSLAEGFGYAFLEPHLWGLPLVGRAVSNVVADFQAEGVSFPGLYQRLLLEGQDFGRLGEDMQREVIRRVVRQPDVAKQVIVISDSGERPLSRWLNEAPVMAAEVIERNRRVVEDRYSLERYGQRLSQALSALAAAKPGATRLSEELAERVRAAFQYPMAQPSLRGSDPPK